MADPRTMPHDLVSRRWETVPDLVHCSRCLGALPPDVDGACEVCGSGTPPVTYTVLDEAFTLTRTEVAALPVLAPRDGERWLMQLSAACPPAPPRPKSWWQRFARWPNV